VETGSTPAGFPIGPNLGGGGGAGAAGRSAAGSTFFCGGFSPRLWAAHAASISVFDLVLNPLPLGTLL
jgi:hypothetical protein